MYLSSLQELPRSEQIMCHTYVWNVKDYGWKVFCHHIICCFVCTFSSFYGEIPRGIVVPRLILSVFLEGIVQIAFYIKASVLSLMTKNQRKHATIFSPKNIIQ